MNYSEDCLICGGDQAAGRLAKLLGHRPDVAWMKLSRLEKATRRLIKATKGRYVKPSGEYSNIHSENEEFLDALAEAESLLEELK